MDFLFFVLFVLAIVIQVAIWLVLFGKLTRYKETSLPGEVKGSLISLVICSKNDGEKLQSHLDQLLVQKDLSQIVLVDDFSETPLETWIDSQADSRISIIKTKIDSPGKKQALIEGVKATSGSIVLVTDADCLPMTSLWVRSMASKISDKKKLVLGYGPLVKSSSSVDRFARYETWYTAQSYFSMALAGLPYMGVGRNMMYEKSLFTKKVFAGDTLVSGDDDLLVQKTATNENTSIQIDPDSFVYSKAPETWSAFLNQKRRHHSTAITYKLIHKLFLVANPASHIACYALFFFLLFTHYALMATSLFVGRLLILWLIGYFNLKKLRENDLLFYLPLLDAFHVLYYIIMTPFLFLSQNSKWK